MHTERRVLVHCSYESDRVGEALVERGLKSSLDLAVRHTLPRLHRFPHEHDRDLSRPRVIEPDFFRQKWDTFEPLEQCLTQSPNVMVDAQELIEMSRVDGKDEHFDGQSFGTPIRVPRLTHARIIFVTQRVDLWSHFPICFRDLRKRSRTTTIEYLDEYALNNHPVVNSVQNDACDERSARPAQREEHHPQKCRHHYLPNRHRQALPE